MRGEPDAPETVLESGCKINLYLKITGRREDGYHTLDSLFLPLSSPSDTVRIARVQGNGLHFSCSDTTLAKSGSNLVEKAYAAYVRATSYAPGLSVFLEKRIPYGAGLGGGSSNAATLLLYLNSEAQRENANYLGQSDLEKLAASLGADVPFFLYNRPAFVRGIGEILTPASPNLSGLYLVLVAPAIHVATAWAFAAWDEKNRENFSGSDLTNTGEEDTSPHVRGIHVRNDLASIVFDRYPKLREFVVALQEQNAAVASMSGSGSSIFGLFENKHNAEDAVRFFCNAGERVFFYML